MMLSRYTYFKWKFECLNAFCHIYINYRHVGQYSFSNECCPSFDETIKKKYVNIDKTYLKGLPKPPGRKTNQVIRDLLRLASFHNLYSLISFCSYFYYMPPSNHFLFSVSSNVQIYNLHSPLLLISIFFGLHWYFF